MKKINLEKIDGIFFDFDGVLTDNFVYVNEYGEETVKCSRADGLGFDALRKLKQNLFIISTESNNVVKQRGQKLKIEVFYGIKNKVLKIKEIAKNRNFKLENSIFIGNDINDLEAMKICGLSICPADSHKKIKEYADFILIKKGGAGIVREIVEDIFEIDITELIYNK